MRINLIFSNTLLSINFATLVIIVIEDTVLKAAFQLFSKGINYTEKCSSEFSYVEVRIMMFIRDVFRSGPYY